MLETVVQTPRFDEFADGLGFEETAWGSLRTFFEELHYIRSRVSSTEWHEICTEVRQHRIHALTQQDPFTARATRKPRGYAGDAVMLDFIYREGPGIQKALDDATDLGRRLNEWTSNVPAARAVRFRRSVLAQMIDRTNDEVRDAEVLSLACGHLREAALSDALSLGLLKRFVAVDQDLESLEIVKTDYGHLGIIPVRNSVRSIVAGQSCFGSFDLVYAAGLFDYLRQDVATRLTTILLNHVKPGGVLLLANFLPDIRDAGYMEAVMDWWLVLRTPDEMRALLAEAQNRVRDAVTFLDPDRNIVFLEVRTC